MSNRKPGKIWIVNVVSFLLFTLLSLTGLINWLILPRGRRAGGEFLINMRHFFRDVHEWMGLLFIVFIIIHLILHWGYIKKSLKKYLSVNL